MSRLLLLLLLLAPNSLWAQPDTPAAAPDSGAERAGAATGADREPEEDANEPRPVATNESPFDYESSEQISEDLSVSFPVDI